MSIEKILKNDTVYKLDPRVNFIIGLNGSGKTTLLEHIYNEYRLEDLSMVYIKQDKQSLLIRGVDSRRVPLKPFRSQGLRDLYNLFRVVVLNMPDVLFLDCPENNLHISIQRDLIKKLLIVHPTMQIICATHAPEIVADFDHNKHIIHV